MGEPVARVAAGGPRRADGQASAAAVVADADVAQAAAWLHAGGHRGDRGGAPAVVGGQAAQLRRWRAADCARGSHGRVIGADRRARRVGRGEGATLRLAERVGGGQCTGRQPRAALRRQVGLAVVAALRRGGRVARDYGGGARGGDVAASHRVRSLAGGDPFLVRAGHGGGLRCQEADGGDAGDEAAPRRGAARRGRRRGRAVATGAGWGGEWHAPSSGVVLSASRGNGVREGGVSTPDALLTNGQRCHRSLGGDQADLHDRLMAQNHRSQDCPSGPHGQLESLASAVSDCSLPCEATSLPSRPQTARPGAVSRHCHCRRPCRRHGSTDRIPSSCAPDAPGSAGTSWSRRAFSCAAPRTAKTARRSPNECAAAGRPQTP